MTEGKEVATRQIEVGFTPSPREILANAQIAARALRDVLSAKPHPVILNNEQYLEFEDWQTAGQFYGYTVKTYEAALVEIDGVKGAKAHADLIDLKTGEIAGGAEAYCMRDEEKWSTRPKYEWQGEGDNRKRVHIGDEIVPWFQLASMAQTRAGAKAFRNRLAWIVVLAGYKGTPAEEMTGGTASEAVQERRTVDKTAHYCSIHNANFFKSGRMKGYAHPIEGTDQWCNEGKEKKYEPASMTEPAPVNAGLDSSPSDVEVSPEIPKAQNTPSVEGFLKEYKTDPETIKGSAMCLAAVKRDFGLTGQQVFAELNIHSTGEWKGTWPDAYRQIAEARAENEIKP